MTEVVELSCGRCVGALLLALGVMVLVWSLRRGVLAARRHDRDPMRALALIQGFRIGVIGFTLALIGIARLWQIGWLFGLALVICGEELLESTVFVAALRHGVRQRHREIATGLAMPNKVGL
jgi:uncharacterized membrane protein HdeD (DUF308 family)